jgi:hypothetical protein
MWDLFITVAITVPLVVGGVWLILRSVARADEAAARALVARLDCPRCRVRSLEWRSVVWGEDVLHDDREDSCHGYTFYCPRCGCEFQYTTEGALQTPAGRLTEPDTPADGGRVVGSS